MALIFKIRYNININHNFRGNVLINNFKYIFIFFILLSKISYAQEIRENNYSISILAGASSQSNFEKLYTFQGLNTSPYKTNIYGLDLGYKLIENIFDLPFDIYSNTGLTYFSENGYQKDFIELTWYIKLMYKLDAFGNQFRFGIAEGISYAGSIPYIEAQEAREKNYNTSKLLNYIELTFDFDIGKFIQVKSMEDYHLGYHIKHRSGVYGLYGVNGGGSNYNCVYLEKTF